MAMPAPKRKAEAVSPVARLTPKQVQRARQDWIAGQATQNQLAKRLKITQAAVSNLLNRKTYKNVA